MKIYETGFLLAPNLSEDDTEKLISQMAEVVSQKEGKLIRQEKWGKHRMAYSIKRRCGASAGRPGIGRRGEVRWPEKKEWRSRPTGNSFRRRGSSAASAKGTSGTSTIRTWT